MKWQTLSILFVATLLSGCFGYPEGTVAPGDVVAVEADAIHPQTGLVLLDNVEARFPIGQGASGLNERLEHRLVGAEEGETVTIHWDGDAPFTFEERHEVDLVLDPVPVRQEVSGETFRQRTGEEPEAGKVVASGYAYPLRVESVVRQQVEVTVQRLDNGSLMLSEEGEVVRSEWDGSSVQEEREEISRTTDVTDNPAFADFEATTQRATTVTFRYELPEDGTLDPVMSLGGHLRSRVVGDEVQRTVEPVEGFVFPAQQGNPYGLPQGAYKVLEVEGDTMGLGRNPDVLAFLNAQEVTYTFRVLEVEQGERQPSGPVDGNYGVRRSAVR